MTKNNPKAKQKSQTCEATAGRFWILVVSAIVLFTTQLALNGQPRVGKCKTNPRLLLSITGAGTDKLQAIYWNWTTKNADDFHVEIDQEFTPGKPPPEPKIDAPPFKEGKSEHTDKEVGEGENKRIRRHIVYKFEGASVPPGGQVKLNVTGGEHADHLVVIWTDKDGKEIDRSKTADGMMGRQSFTQNPPAGAND